MRFTADDKLIQTAKNMFLTILLIQYRECLAEFPFPSGFETQIL